MAAVQCLKCRLNGACSVSVLEVSHMTTHARFLSLMRMPLLQVVMLYTIGIIACLTALRFSPSGAFKLQALIVFCLGFCIYGPQMLIGLCGAELVGAESVGASEGFLGWIAYLGAANAGARSAAPTCLLIFLQELCCLIPMLSKGELDDV